MRRPWAVWAQDYGRRYPCRRPGTNPSDAQTRTNPSVVSSQTNPSEKSERTQVTCHQTNLSEKSEPTPSDLPPNEPERILRLHHGDEPAEELRRRADSAVLGLDLDPLAPPASPDARGKRTTPSPPRDPGQAAVAPARPSCRRASAQGFPGSHGPWKPLVNYDPLRPG
jgi:hypothetical protein